MSCSPPHSVLLGEDLGWERSGLAPSSYNCLCSWAEEDPLSSDKKGSCQSPSFYETDLQRIKRQGCQKTRWWETVLKANRSSLRETNIVYSLPTVLQPCLLTFAKKSMHYFSCQLLKNTNTVASPTHPYPHPILAHPATSELGCVLKWCLCSVFLVWLVRWGFLAFLEGVMSWGGKINYSFSWGSYPRVHSTWFECVADSEELSWKIAKDQRES